MRYTLHHLDTPRQSPRKARSVLCPGRVLLIVDWVGGAQMGVAEWCYEPQAVAGWVCEAGFQLLGKDVRGQSMVTGDKLLTAVLERTGEEAKEN